MDRCQYDAGSMFGCSPVCDSPAVVAVEYSVPCYGAFRVRLCRRHVSPMAGRVFPSRLVEVS